MKDLLAVAVVMAAALAVAAASVGPGRDTGTLVSPPEAVAEQFVRKLAGSRYDAALAHLDDHSPAMQERIPRTSDQLRARAGAIEQVEGKPGVIDGDRATATAAATTNRGEITMAFTLVRRSGSWKIAEF